MPYLTTLIYATVAILAVTVLIRIVGLRSLSKMSGFDFVTTIATGSILATAITAAGGGLWIALAGLAALFALQWIIAAARLHIDPFRRLVENEPLLLMEDGRMIDDNLRRAQVAPEDVYAKLREANALDLSCVRAVVMETTGDISVLHADPGAVVSPELMQGVKR